MLFGGETCEARLALNSMDAPFTAARTGQAPWPTACFAAAQRHHEGWGLIEEREAPLTALGCAGAMHGLDAIAGALWDVSRVGRCPRVLRVALHAR